MNRYGGFLPIIIAIVAAMAIVLGVGGYAVYRTQLHPSPNDTGIEGRVFIGGGSVPCGDSNDHTLRPPSPCVSQPAPGPCGGVYGPCTPQRLHEWLRGSDTSVVVSIFSLEGVSKTSGTNGILVAKISTDQNGYFRAMLSPGPYSISITSLTNASLVCPPATVQVSPHAMSEQNIVCNFGIY